VSDAADKAARHPGCAFFGTVSAGLSHELTNVFATINELSGLLGDLAAAGQRGKPLDPRRLESISQRINSQVERGQRQAKRLNRFAHSVDGRGGHTDLNAVTQEVLGLFERVARLRKVEVLSVLPDVPLFAATEAFELYQLVWRSLEAGVGAVGEGGQLELQLRPTGSGAELSVCSRGSAPVAAPSSELVAALQELVRALRGQLSLEAEAGSTFRLTVPLPESPT
jgi:C4-dicarboxylate-specific signal transduction histidine kinase